MTSYLDRINKLLSKEPDPAYKRRASIILKNINLLGHSNLLEVGCGRGFYINSISHLFPESNIWGIDLCEKYLSIAAKNKGKNVRLLKSDATDLPFENNYFDIIIASEILEHIPNDIRAISEMYRVLKPDGKIVITIPSKNYPFFWDPINWVLERTFKCHLPSNIWWLSGIWADHVRLYSEKEITKKVINMGFKIEKEWTSTHYCLPFSHFLFYGIGKNIVERGLLPGFNRFNKKKPVNFIYKVLLWPVYFIDKLNNENEKYKSCVNLVMIFKKIS